MSTSRLYKTGGYGANASGGGVGDEAHRASFHRVFLSHVRSRFHSPRVSVSSSVCHHS